MRPDQLFLGAFHWKCGSCRVLELVSQRPRTVYATEFLLICLSFSEIFNTAAVLGLGRTGYKYTFSFAFAFEGFAGSRLLGLRRLKEIRRLLQLILRTVYGDCFRIKSFSYGCTFVLLGETTFVYKLVYYFLLDFEDVVC